jgi:TfoX/Sxy family transcriptional regulator of competence genes
MPDHFRKGGDMLERLIDDAMAGIPHEKKKMFGCPAFFAQGNMFAGVYRSSIFLRLGEEDRNRLLGTSKEIQPFEPLPGRVMRQYLAIPDSLCEDAPFVQGWLKKSHAYALTLPPRNEKSMRTRKKGH